MSAIKIIFKSEKPSKEFLTFKLLFHKMAEILFSDIKEDVIKFGGFIEVFQENDDYQNINFRAACNNPELLEIMTNKLEALKSNKLNLDIGSTYDKAGFTNEIDLYLDCMYDLRRMILFIGNYMTKDENLLKDNITYTIELISLQYRKIFELICISSLVTNQNKFSTQHEQLKNEYKPDYIIRGIEKVNPNFFPDL